MSIKKTLRASVAPLEETPPLLHQVWYRTDEVVRYFGYSSVKTFRNQVSRGQMPRPVLLPCGPRWHIDVLRAIESGEWKPEAEKAFRRGRGRPRIAAQRAGGAK